MGKNQRKRMRSTFQFTNPTTDIIEEVDDKSSISGKSKRIKDSQKRPRMRNSHNNLKIIRKDEESNELLPKTNNVSSSLDP